MMHNLDVKVNLLIEGAQRPKLSRRRGGDKRELLMLLTPPRRLPPAPG